MQLKTHAEGAGGRIEVLTIDLKMAAWGVLARLMDDQRHILDQVDQLMLHVYLTTNLKLRKKQIGYLQRLAGKEYNLTPQVGACIPTSVIPSFYKGMGGGGRSLVRLSY